MRAAFFDVDNTLLDLKSMFRFQQFYFRRTSPSETEGEARYRAFEQELREDPRAHDRHYLNALYYRSYAGRARRDVEELARQWFAWEAERAGGRLWIAPAVMRLNAHLADGTAVLLVSGSCHELLRPVAEALGAQGSLATDLEVDGQGRYTGRIAGLQMIGEGKAEAIRRYAGAHGADLRACHAYGDHVTDLAMLEVVGHPVVVPGDTELERIARARGWEVLAVAIADTDALHA